jgi:hypothetical protein
MPAQVLGGPVWWYFFGMYVLTIVLALFVLVDSLTPRRKARLAEIREPGWLYSVATAVYLACVVAVWIPGMPRILSVVPVVLAIPALVLEIAYLLRVVFPKPAPAGESDAVSESDPLDL